MVKATRHRWQFLLMLGGFALVMPALLFSASGAGVLFAQDPGGTPEPSDGTEPDDDGLPFDPQSEDIIERGAYLVRVEASCVQCHGDEGYAEDPLNISLSGGRSLDMFVGENYDFAGTAYGTNLTTLQEWTDEEIENAIRYGVAPDSTVLLPPMPYNLFAGMADADMEAIIAYLRSLEPVEKEIPAAELAGDLTREDIRTVPEFDPEAEFPYPDGIADDPVVRGAYMAMHTSHCLNCHGALGEDGFVDPEGLPLGTAIEFYPPLLQEDMAGFSDDDLRALFKDIELFDMPTFSFQYLVPEDVEALIAWIRAQPSRSEVE